MKREVEVLRVFDEINSESIQHLKKWGFLMLENIIGLTDESKVFVPRKYMALVIIFGRDGHHNFNHTYRRDSSHANTKTFALSCLEELSGLDLLYKECDKKNIQAKGLYQIEIKEDYGEFVLPVASLCEEPL